MNPNDETSLRDLWENRLDISAESLSIRFGLPSKNSVIGIARRRNWKPRRELRIPVEARKARNRMYRGHASRASRAVLRSIGIDPVDKLVTEDLKQLPALTSEEEQDWPRERTIFGRLDLTHARMDAVLCETTRR